MTTPHLLQHISKPIESGHHLQSTQTNSLSPPTDQRSLWQSQDLKNSSHNMNQDSTSSCFSQTSQLKTGSKPSTPISETSGLQTIKNQLKPTSADSKITQTPSLQSSTNSLTVQKKQERKQSNGLVERAYQESFFLFKKEMSLSLERLQESRSQSQQQMPGSIQQPSEIQASSHPPLISKIVQKIKKSREAITGQNSPQTNSIPSSSLRKRQTCLKELQSLESYPTIYQTQNLPEGLTEQLQAASDQWVKPSSTMKTTDPTSSSQNALKSSTVSTGSLKEYTPSGFISPSGPTRSTLLRDNLPPLKSILKNRSRLNHLQRSNETDGSLWTQRQARFNQSLKTVHFGSPLKKLEIHLEKKKTSPSEPIVVLSEEEEESIPSPTKAIPAPLLLSLKRMKDNEPPPKPLVVVKPPQIRPIKPWRYQGRKCKNIHGFKIETHTFRQLVSYERRTDKVKGTQNQVQTVHKKFLTSMPLRRYSVNKRLKVDVSSLQPHTDRGFHRPLYHWRNIIGYSLHNIACRWDNGNAIGWHYFLPTMIRNARFNPAYLTVLKERKLYCPYYACRSSQRAFLSEERRQWMRLWFTILKDYRKHDKRMQRKVDDVHKRMMEAVIPNNPSDYLHSTFANLEFQLMLLKAEINRHNSGLTGDAVMEALRRDYGKIRHRTCSSSIDLTQTSTVTGPEESKRGILRGAYKQIQRSSPFWEGPDLLGQA